MKSQLVSICIPTFNGERFLNEALNSIREQTYRHIEVIISDDASSDGTLEIANRFKSEVAFPVSIIQHTPSGIGANWNNCIKHASGAFIKFLFQDDILHSQCIEKMVDAFNTNPDLGLVGCKRDFLIEKDVDPREVAEWITAYGDLQSDMNRESNGDVRLDSSLFGHPGFYKSPLNKIGEPSAVLFRKDITDRVGLFHNGLDQVLDFEYWYRILKIAPILILDEKLVSFRIHGKQATQKNKDHFRAERRLYEKLLYKDYFKLLNPGLKDQLSRKYHPVLKYYYKLKKKLSGA